MDSSVNLSVIVPAYNEEEVLQEFHVRLSEVLNEIGGTSEILYINDGSKDRTLEIILSLRENDPRVALVDLSRNFGKELALSAGIEYARGECVVIIDADLQDPPELIGEFLKKYREGYDVVYALRIRREGETWFKRFTAFAFYRVIQKMSPVAIPTDAGDYRLLSRRAVDALKKLKEHHRFMKGLFAWIGYRQIAVPYYRDRRFAGVTKWNYWKLWNFAIEGITSFSTVPLKVSTYLGMAIAIVAFFFVLVVIYKTLMWGEPVKGYPSLMVTILFLGGLQLMSVGVLGEYLGRIFNETKRRPLYLVSRYEPSQAMPEDEAHRKNINKVP